MPLITMTYASSREKPALKSDIAAIVSELTAKILHKDPKVTAIIVKSVNAADWFAGGKSLAEQKLATYTLAAYRPRRISLPIMGLIVVGTAFAIWGGDGSDAAGAPSRTTRHQPSRSTRRAPAPAAATPVARTAA